MQTPFAISPDSVTQYRKTSLTLFDVNMVILVCILFIHCLMNLFIAKESALIYADEVYNKSLSKLLDKKREGNGLSKGESKQEREGFENEIHRLTYLNLEDSKKKPIINLVFGLVFLFALINTAKG